MNNQLTENSVNQLLNSVRLARDNAERADNRVDHAFYYALTRALEELQEHRKADAELKAARDSLLQPDKITCERCGRTTTHPEGWHYCHGGKDGQ